MDKPSDWVVLSIFYPVLVFLFLTQHFSESKNKVLYFQILVNVLNVFSPSWWLSLTWLILPRPVRSRLNPFQMFLYHGMLIPSELC